MEEFISFLISEITNSKDFKIETSNENEGVEGYTVKIPKEFMGMVIGKNGKTINSIRNLVRVKAVIEKKKINLNILEA